MRCIKEMPQVQREICIHTKIQLPYANAVCMEEKGYPHPGSRAEYAANHNCNNNS